MSIESEKIREQQVVPSVGFRLDGSWGKVSRIHQDVHDFIAKMIFARQHAASPSSVARSVLGSPTLSRYRPLFGHATLESWLGSDQAQALGIVTTGIQTPPLRRRSDWGLAFCSTPAAEAIKREGKGPRGRWCGGRWVADGEPDLPDDFWPHPERRTVLDPPTAIARLVETLIMKSPTPLPYNQPKSQPHGPHCTCELCWTLPSSLTPTG